MSASAQPAWPVKLAYFVLSQAGWFACVLSAARHVPWVGVAVAAALLACHFLYAARPMEEAKLLASAVLIGAVWESTLVACGWLTYPSGTWVSGTAPYWILALWALFAATLNVLFGSLKRHLALAAVLGAVAGPMSFWGGAKLGGVRFDAVWAGLAALAVGWSLITPGLLMLARRWNGIGEPVPRIRGWCNVKPFD